MEKLFKRLITYDYWILILSILVCLFVTVGCKDKTPQPDKKMKSVRSIVVNDLVLYVYEIEGHEYIGYIKTNGEFSTHPSFNCFLVHSEKCKNPAHFPKKGTVLVHKDGSSYVLPDTLVEKDGYKVENGVIEIQ